MAAKNDALGRSNGRSTGFFACSYKFFAWLSRFLARSWPPGLDFGSPGRSWDRFWKPKRPRFRVMLSFMPARFQFRAKCTKHWQELHFWHIGASARQNKNDKNSVCEHARLRSMLQSCSDAGLGRSGGVPGPAKARLWTLMGCICLARGIPRAVLGRRLAVPSAARARPGTSPKRLWAPRTARERISVDFSAILVAFSSIIARFVSNFRRISVRLWS